MRLLVKYWYISFKQRRSNSALAQNTNSCATSIHSPCNPTHFEYSQFLSPPHSTTPTLLICLIVLCLGHFTRHLISLIKYSGRSSAIYRISATLGNLTWCAPCYIILWYLFRYCDTYLQQKIKAQILFFPLPSPLTCRNCAGTTTPPVSPKSLS